MSAEIRLHGRMLIVFDYRSKYFYGYFMLVITNYRQRDVTRSLFQVNRLRSLYV